MSGLSTFKTENLSALPSKEPILLKNQRRLSELGAGNPSYEFYRANRDFARIFIFASHAQKLELLSCLFRPTGAFGYAGNLLYLDIFSYFWAGATQKDQDMEESKTGYRVDDTLLQEAKEEGKEGRRQC
ncbi:MAG: hypothetical protein M1816_006718 [Peltula sp. TS41687]|nr:MAG: hypothetical protein M1816_006718 [Peltula sp. TS41687]